MNNQESKYKTLANVVTKIAFSNLDRSTKNTLIRAVEKEMEICFMR